MIITMHRFIYKEKDIEFGLLTLNEKQIMEDLRRSLVMTMEQDPQIIRLNKAVKEDIPRIREALFQEYRITQKDLDNYMFHGFTDKHYECEHFLSCLKQSVKKEYPDLDKLLKHKEKQLANIEQECLYYAIRKVRPRMDRKDAMGERVLSPRGWMDKFKELNGDAAKSRELMVCYFDKDVQLAGGNGHPDIHIAPFVKRLQELGLQVLTAYSGTVGSTPGIRIPIEDKRYPAGSHPSYGSLANMTKIEIVFRNANPDSMLGIAIDSGWNVEDIEDNGLDICRLSLPVCNKFPELTYDALVKSAEEKGMNPYDYALKYYGGLVVYTDQMVLDRLEILAQKIEEHQDWIKSLNQPDRISDINVFYTGKEPYKQMNISCSIDGVQQSGKRIGLRDQQFVEEQKDSPRLSLLLEQLAYRYFKDELKNEQQQQKGLRR